MEFHETTMGRKFFNADLPKLTRQLGQIATELKTYNDEVEAGNAEFLADKPPGKFEDISENEQAELEDLSQDFDKWFELMLKSFDLNKDVEYTFEDVKRLTLHAWNANK